MQLAAEQFCSGRRVCITNVLLESAATCRPDSGQHTALHWDARQREDGGSGLRNWRVPPDTCSILRIGNKNN